MVDWIRIVSCPSPYIHHSASLTASRRMKSMAEIGQDPPVAGEDLVHV